MKPGKPVATIIKSIIDLFIYFNCLFYPRVLCFPICTFQKYNLELNGLIWEYE